MPKNIKKLTEKWKRNIGIANAISQKGKKLSEEHKKKIGFAGIGRRGHWRDKKLSIEHKEKISNSIKIRKEKLGYINSPEAREKMRQLQLGSKCLFWKGGKSFEEYGSAFDNGLKEQVRFRDKYTCQLCNCPQIENAKQLDCHHIDYNKKNNKLNNLIALCHSCHAKTNINRHYWSNILKGNMLGVFVE